MKIKLNSGNAKAFFVDCDLIFTDPPFDMPGHELNEILSGIRCDHLFLITTMKQFVELMACSSWALNFDVVLDAVIPKKSKSIHQPNYTHANGFYLTRNKAKSIFDRKLKQRSDTFDNNGYWPSIIRAPRERLKDHGMAKNEQAVVDILGSFKADHIYDCFAGSGTTGFACIELDRRCTLTELDVQHIEKMKREFRFLL